MLLLLFQARLKREAVEKIEEKEREAEEEVRLEQLRIEVCSQLR